MEKIELKTNTDRLLQIQCMYFQEENQYWLYLLCIYYHFAKSWLRLHNLRQMTKGLQKVVMQSNKQKQVEFVL